MMRRIMKTAFLNCIQRRHVREHQKSIEEFENAFSVIKASTGIQHIEEIVNIFVGLESKNYSLLTYVNDMNAEIEALEAAQRRRHDLEEEHHRVLDEQHRMREDAIRGLDIELNTTLTATNQDQQDHD